MANLLQTLKNVFSSNASSEQAIISEQKTIAFKEYPENTKMQNHLVKEQLSAYRHIQTLNDVEIKELVIQKYPANYTMQRHIYQQQLSAKNYMKTAVNIETKVEAEKRYPNDYFAQKFVYDSGNMSA
jgi:hypothetical protein